jgi:hypothetical protein
LALRRQSIRTLTDTSCASPTAVPVSGTRPGTDRQTISGGTSVIKVTGAVASAVVHLTGGILNPSGG